MAKANSCYLRSKTAKKWAEQERRLNSSVDGKIMKNLTDMTSTKPIKKTITKMVRVADGIIKCKRVAIHNY